jgi:hypothetical protein
VPQAPAQNLALAARASIGKMRRLKRDIYDQICMRELAACQAAV